MGMSGCATIGGCSRIDNQCDDNVRKQCDHCSRAAQGEYGIRGRVDQTGPSQSYHIPFQASWVPV